MLTSKEQSILNVLEPLAQEHNVEIVTIELTGAKKAPVIRVYISTSQGVSFNELTDAQTWIGEKLEEIDPFPGAYVLEVSSPGIDRPLRTLQHFKDAINENVRIKTLEPIEGSKHFKGNVSSVSEDSVELICEQGKVVLPFNSISKANVVGTVEF